MKNCQIEGCTRRYTCKGYCNTHYYYWRRKGVPETDKSKAQIAKYGKGTLTPDGYRLLSKDGRRIKEHRWVLEQHLGRKLESWEHIHHINENKLDNRVENLKIVTNSEHRREHRITPDEEKSCSRCHKVKTLDNFAFRLNSPNMQMRLRFYDSWCKDCKNEVNRIYKKRIRSRLI